MTVRAPAVAGMFYPADAGQLRHDVSALLQGAQPALDQTPKVLIVPHAGYIYSGPTAASAYKLLQPLRKVIKRVVLFGPAHRVYLEGMAVPGVDAFATPLGEVLLDCAMLAKLAALPGVCTSAIAHRDEHSLEVQLPFLQVVLEDFQLVPVAVGDCAPAAVAAALDAAWGGPETLIVISSDLSHFLAYAQAQVVDGNTSRKILSKQPDLTGAEACGAMAVNGLFTASHCADLTITGTDLRNSGDTAGDKTRVVGYGAFVLH